MQQKQIINCSFSLILLSANGNEVSARTAIKRQMKARFLDETGNPRVSNSCQRMGSGGGVCVGGKEMIFLSALAQAEKTLSGLNAAVLTSWIHYSYVHTRKDSLGFFQIDIKYK